MAAKDFIAQLFRVRRERFGISDDIYWGWYHPDTGEVEWNTWPHADADGIGGFANILRPLGFPCDPLPVCGETYEPSWLEIIRAARASAHVTAPKRVNWKRVHAFSASDRRLPEVAVLDRAQSAALKAKADASGVGVGNIVFSAMSRVVARQLIAGEAPFHWFMGVNVRGAAKVADDRFNQASGVSVLVYPESDAAHWRKQVRLGLTSRSHWVTWKLARLSARLGDHALALLYRLSARTTFYAGSCAHMGDWPLEDVRNPAISDRRLLCAVGPGTANYPVNASMIGWNGSTVLVLKLHPMICARQGEISALVNAWRDALLRELA